MNSMGSAIDIEHLQEMYLEVVPKPRNVMDARQEARAPLPSGVRRSAAALVNRGCSSGNVEIPAKLKAKMACVH